jgi:CheY-like chemotaxis protein
LAPRSTKDLDSLIVLVVEDEVLVRDDIARCLRERGCVVLEADTAEQAVAMCQAGKRVDVLLTDINLNGSGSGWDVADAFRVARPGIAVVYVSGNSVDRSRCVPGSLFFNKPYRDTDLLQACQVLANNISAGAPGRIRTSDPQIRSARTNSEHREIICAISEG